MLSALWLRRSDLMVMAMPAILSLSRRRTPRNTFPSNRSPQGLSRVDAGASVTWSAFMPTGIVLIGMLLIMLWFVVTWDE